VSDRVVDLARPQQQLGKVQPQWRVVGGRASTALRRLWINGSVIGQKSAPSRRGRAPTIRGSGDVAAAREF
jgi:hypothetical protein